MYTRLMLLLINLYPAMLYATSVTFAENCSPKLASENQFLLLLKHEQSVAQGILNCLNQAKINSAFIQGIGTVKNPVLAYYDPILKEYESKRYRGFYQMNGLMGNVTESNGRKVLHLHLTIGRNDNSSFSGHFVTATVGVNAEIVVTPIANTIKRSFDKGLKLNLIEPTM